MKFSLPIAGFCEVPSHLFKIMVQILSVTDSLQFQGPLCRLSNRCNAVLVCSNALLHHRSRQSSGDMLVVPEMFSLSDNSKGCSAESSIGVVLCGHAARHCCSTSRARAVEMC